MALTHLIDTSAINRLREPTVLAVVEPLVRARRVGRAGITDLEIGYGSRKAAEWDADLRALEIFPLVETTGDDLVRARTVQRLLASRSQRGRKIPDLLIAAAAERERLELLHFDHDFDRIAKVTGQRCSWVVPPGSVD